MMLQIFLHHFLGNVAGAPRSVADCPEVPAPIPLAQVRVFLLQHPRCPPLKPFHQVRQRLRRRILNVHMDVIFTHHAFEDPHVFGVTDLHEQVATAQFNVTFKDVVAVLGHPHDMGRQAGEGVAAVAVVSHWPRLLPRRRDG